MIFRNFSQEIETLAKVSFERPFVSNGFKQLSPPTATADGAFRVELDGVEIAAYAKPGRIHEHAKLTVAHEKLASDLAYLLRLPVPPVQILLNGSDPNLPDSLALSYIVFETARPFSERGAANVEEATWAALQPSSSAMRVFYSWIKDVDHGGHEQNLIFGRVSGLDAMQLAFIDHSYAFTHGGRYEARLAPPVHQIFANDDNDAVNFLIGRVIALPKEDIIESVTRLSAWFPEGEAPLLAAALCDAREGLADLFGRQ